MTVRGGVTIAAVVVVGVVVATLDALVGPPPVPDSPVAQVVEARAGEAVCAVGERAADAQVATVMTNVGENTDANVAVRTLEGGDGAAETTAPLASERITSIALEHPLAVRWWDAPVAVHREWVIDPGDRPAGVVAGACSTVVSSQWIVPGLVTAGGAEARLQLVNPYRADATVAIRFFSPEGPERPLATQNLSVPAGDGLTVVVNEILPERSDLAAVVDVEAGRVTVEGVQFVRSAIGGIDGAARLAAAPQPAETWYVPWIAVDDEVSSWLWIVNPSDRDAVLDASVHTPDGGTVIAELDHAVVGPGSMQRVDLAAALPDGETVAAVTVRADGTPIVVGAGTRIAADAPEATAFHVHTAGAELDHRWVVSLLHRPGRVEQLHLINPGSEHAVVDVTLVTPNGVRRTAELADVHVGPGARTALDLGPVLEGLDESTAVSAIVTASGGPIVAARVGADVTGARRLTVVPGIPSSAWRSAGAIALAGFDADLTQRLGTGMGIRPRESDSALVEGPPVGPAPSTGPDVDVEPRPTTTPDVDPIPGGGSSGTAGDGEPDGAGETSSDAPDAAS